MATRTNERARKKQARHSKVLAGYLRLTVDRDGKKIGYEVQRKAILKWCDLYGYSIGRWYQDKDVTAADRKIVRPEYEAMLKDVSAGLWGGIVVWKLDRLVRLTREFERCNGIVEDAGGFISSVDPAFNTKDQFGKFVMSILVGLAEMEIATMRARQRGHQKEKAEQGRHHGGGARAFGFVGPIKDPITQEVTNRNSGEIGVKQIPEEVALLQEAARRVAWEGDTYSAVLNDWATRNPPVLGTNGQPMSAGSLVDLLTRHRIVGKRSYDIYDDDGEFVSTEQYQAAWPAIIDELTWNRLRAMRTSRADNGRPNAYLLTGGIIKCGKCGQNLVGGRRKHWKSDEVLSAYRCQSTAEAKVRGSCGGMNVIAEPVERIVTAYLVHRWEDSPELLEVDVDEAHSEQLTEALAEIARVEKDLALIAAQKGSAELMEFEYQAQRKPLAERHQRASSVVEALSATRSLPVPAQSDRANLLAWFENLSQPQRRALVEAHLDTVAIKSALRGRHEFDPTRVVITPADSKKVRRG